MPSNLRTLLRECGNREESRRRLVKELLTRCSLMCECSCHATVTSCPMCDDLDPAMRRAVELAVQASGDSHQERGAAK